MIQRIQTLYLSLTILLSLIFLSGSIFGFTDISGRLIEAKFSGVMVASSGEATSLVHNTFPVTVSVLLVTISSLITIFLFRFSKIQLRLAVSVIIFVCISIATEIYCIWFITTEYNSRFNPGYKIIIPAAMLIFSVLAYRGIRIDYNLVKSYDRLR